MVSGEGAEGKGEVNTVQCYTLNSGALCDLFSLPQNGSEQNSESLLLFFDPRNRIPSGFSSAKWFGMEFQEFASIFVPQNGIPSCFLFRGTVRNGIPNYSVPRNSRNSVGNDRLFRLFRLPRNYFFVGNSQP